MQYTSVLQTIWPATGWREGDLNWSDLQVLLAFEQERTLQKAAQKLGLDISTVSRRIRALEDDLGSKLVENVSGRLVLTTYGEQAVQAAATMAIESDRLQRIIKGEENLLSGVLRVALLDALVSFHQDLLQSFCLQYPHITLELVCGTSRVHSLTRREADVAIRVSKQPDDTLVGMRALHTEYAIYAHHSVAEKPPKCWADLPWIGWDSASNARMIDAWMEKHVPPEKIRFRVDSAIAQFTIAKAGGGACILPVVYADLSHTLVRLSEVLDGFDTNIWLLTHRDLRQNGRVQAFLKHFYQGLEPFRKNEP
jgi:DNA-binding transcriptional LysR family regulator